MCNRECSGCVQADDEKTQYALPVIPGRNSCSLGKQQNCEKFLFLGRRQSTGVYLFTKMSRTVDCNSHYVKGVSGNMEYFRVKCALKCWYTVFYCVFPGLVLPATQRILGMVTQNLVYEKALV